MTSPVYLLLQIKRYTEQVLMWPFVAYGRLRASREPSITAYDLVCFFPGYALGGAEKVHADVVDCFPDKRILIYFTRRSANDKMLHLFQREGVTIRDISAWTDNKYKYWQNFIWRGICAGLIARQKNKPVVFSGQCNFGYKVLPHLPTGVRKVELIHVAEKKFSWITFPFIGLIDQRVMISDIIIQRALHFYRSIGVPTKYDQRIQKIINHTELPPDVPVRTYTDPLKVYYAGRGGYPKRLYLLMEVVRKSKQLNLPIEFHFAGSIADEIPAELTKEIIYHGELQGGEAMRTLHQKMDILFMSSASEAFPMLIMEAMANGVVVISTSVGGIPEHIHTGNNGLLVTAEDENAIVDELLHALQELSRDREQIKRLAEASRQYAFNYFGKKPFCEGYRKVLFG
ncbi:MAG: glycosyltransferase family 4 protein [Chitinophagaceae bacterium]|nr:glycosyltransferase family 4 protein [Chitinophagaceae bacterium]